MHVDWVGHWMKAKWGRCTGSFQPARGPHHCGHRMHTQRATNSHPGLAREVCMEEVG